MAIDQPIDFSVRESTIMLAVYLSVPEVENINLTTVEGKKIITPNRSEAGIIRWVFLQLAKNIHRIEEVRKMAAGRGLKCSRSYFFRFIRNPAYCGLIPIKSESEEGYMVKGIHEPLISEALFYEVQKIINIKRKITSQKDDLKATFYLRGILECLLYHKKLSESFCRGSTKRYPYYHCQKRCKTRINALFLNECYQRKLG